MLDNRVLRINSEGEKLGEVRNLLRLITSKANELGLSIDQSVFTKLRNEIDSRSTNLSKELNEIQSKCSHEFYKEITPYKTFYICSKCGFTKD